MMGLPPVFVGLVLYIILSASGPLGALELIYTPAAMIIAQFFLITPIIVSLTRQVLEEMTREYDELLNSLQANTKEKILTILWDARYSLLTCILAGLGRSLSEVGAIIIVGGNIAHVTRVMTTTMLLETTKGNLEIAIALGFVLIFISILINLLVFVLKEFAQRYSYD
jgi:tungstate transport system permease protein